jgi:hypothetical protein
MNDRVTIEDIRRAGYCVRGARGWFDSRGLNFRAFLKDGMSVADARALRDGHMDTVLARKESADG